MIPLGACNQAVSEQIIYLKTSNITVSLDEYYKSIKGHYPKARVQYTFMVPENVTVVATDVASPSVVDGLNWPVDAKIMLINYGQLLGRGGKAGRSAEYISKTRAFYLNTPNPANEDYIHPSTPGQDGGNVLFGARSIPMTVINHGIIGAGGGGGGGAGCSIYIRRQSAGSAYIYIPRAIGGGGAGGGAPYGERTPNANTIESYFNNPIFAPHYSGPLTDTTKLQGFQFGINSKAPYWVTKFHSLIPVITPQPSDYDTEFDILNVHSFVPHYLPDNIQYRLITSTTDVNKRTPGMSSAVYNGITYYERLTDSVFKQSEDGTLLKGGLGGYGGLGLNGTGSLIELGFTEYFNIDHSATRGGDGGGIGEPGKSGTRYNPATINQKSGTWPGDYGLRGGYGGSTGGLAGYVFTGNVSLTNESGGVIKGRMSA